MPETIRVERSGRRADVVLARPSVRNAIDDRLVREVTEAFAALSADGALRVVVIRGEGKAFCAGADLEWMKRMAAASREENVRDAMALAGMFRAVAECPKYVIARVHGAAMGGGVGLVAAADAAVCEGSILPMAGAPPAQAPVVPATGTKFALSEVRLGLVPSVISEVVLRRIGPGHARTLFGSGESFDAAAALRMGLVAEVVPEGRLDESVDRRAAEILLCGPAAVAAAKALLREQAAWGALGPAERDLRAATLIAELRGSPEGREGMAAFLGKRKPGWCPP